MIALIVSIIGLSPPLLTVAEPDNRMVSLYVPNMVLEAGQ